MEKRVTVIGANKVFFAFTILFIAFQFVLVVVTSVLSITFREDYTSSFLSNNIYFILLFNQFVLILLPVLIYVIKKRLDFRKVFRIKRLGLSSAALILLLSIPAFFVAVMLNTIVLYFLQFIGNIPSQPIPVPGNLSELIIGILIIGVTPAICEEMLHRGILLSAYEKRGSIKAVVITAIFFGIFHFDITNLLGATFLGLLIGYYVIRTNSIFAGMLAHFLNNAISELLQYFLGNGQQPDIFIKIPAGELFSTILYGVTGLILVGLLLILFRKVTLGRAQIVAPITGIKNDFISVISHWPIIVISVLYVLTALMTLLSIILSKAI